MEEILEEMSGNTPEIEETSGNTPEIEETSGKTPEEIYEQYVRLISSYSTHSKTMFRQMKNGEISCTLEIVNELYDNITHDLNGLKELYSNE